MNDPRSTLEEAAESENAWVRARILKQDERGKDYLLEIAERGRRMAEDSLGSNHPAHAVALQNLGLYYDAIEGDREKADDYFARAQVIVGAHDLVLADGYYWLGVFHSKISLDEERSVFALAQALAIQRRALAASDPKLADALQALAHAKTRLGDYQGAAAMLQETLDIQRAHAQTDEATSTTARRLAILRALANAKVTDRGDKM